VQCLRPNPPLEDVPSRDTQLSLLLHSELKADSAVSDASSMLDLLASDNTSLQIPHHAARHTFEGDSLRDRRTFITLTVSFY
jgi:hypothetical protein